MALVLAQELEVSNRELGNELRTLKAQIGTFEKNRNDATSDMTEARMSSRLLEEDVKKTKRQYEDAKVQQQHSSSLPRMMWRRAVKVTPCCGRL